MTLHTYPTLEQGTDEWLEARRGILTASVIGQLITPSLKVASNDTSRGLIATLAGERITGHVEDAWVSSDMQRGTDEEPIARDLYAKHFGVEVAEVGFIVREDNGVRVGYSPDGLTTDDGLIEVKSRKPKKHLTTILSDRVPAENMAQIQCGLWVTERDWCDYISNCGGMRPWIKRVFPDPDWFEAIESAAQSFETSVNVTISAYEAATLGLPETERTPDYNDVELKLA